MLSDPQPGSEEVTAFRLMEKALESAERLFEVYSVIGRVSLPGWIVIEASRICDVKAFCEGVNNIYAGDVHFINPDDGPRYLKEPPSYTPVANSWVRLHRYPYRGDLAFIRSVQPSSLSATVIVIPRIDFNSLAANTGKRKRGHRPIQSLFDANKVAAAYGRESVQRRNPGVFIFKGDIYKDGYLELEVESLRAEATPSKEELLSFGFCPLIPLDFVKRNLDLLHSETLNSGDTVKVAKGALAGSLGRIHTVHQGEAEVLTSTNTRVTLPVSVLRRNFEVGDNVIVAIGKEAGMTGLVVSVIGENITLWDVECAKEASSFAFSCRNDILMTYLSTPYHHITWSSTVRL